MIGLRVLLMNPPTAVTSSVPILNLCYLAGVLRSAGHDVFVLDATAPYARRTPAEIAKVIQEYRPDFIGVTLTITHVPESYAYIKSLQIMGIPIVLGGPHPNACPQEVLDNGGDIVCIGEGEETIVELAEFFQGKREKSTVNGICFKDEFGKTVFTPARQQIKNLDSLPFLDFSDFPIQNYSGSSDPMSNPMFWSIFSSRGCPFDCTFCSSHNVFGRTIRLRSAHNVFDEIKLLTNRYRIKSLAFQDDEILCSKERFLKFCELIEKSGLNLKMSIRTRIDSIDPEVLKRAKQAGITRISFGIESWDDETLLKINKKYDVKTIHEHLKYLSDAQPIHVSFNNILGFPWQTRRHYRNTIRELKKIPKNIKYFSNTATPIPYPKTRLYEDYHKEYGFTDWWLDSTKHRQVTYAHDTPPFFILFAHKFLTLYFKAFQWNYSKKQIADIDWFSWKVFRLFLKRHLNLLEYPIISLLCRVSHWLWWRDRELEYRVFSGLGKKVFVEKLREKVSFTDKY